MRRAFHLLLIVIALSNVSISLCAETSISANQCFSKGGLGIIHRGVYVVVNSHRNELKFGQGQSWVGSTRITPEVVFIQNDRVIENPKTNTDFDLSKCLLVSFQPDRVMFFDFTKSKGGYYLRFNNEPLPAP